MEDQPKKHSEGAPGNRHRSRILALQTLYACEIGTTQEWKIMLERIADGSSLPSTVISYARELLTKLYSSTAAIDDLIQKRAANWDIKRMAAIDRNILRLAATELSHFREVPAKVVIDEAVELAKSFGAEDSGKFVNGIIDSIHKNLNATKSASGKEGPLHGTDTCPK
jgi:N utilization substance protein B